MESHGSHPPYRVLVEDQCDTMDYSHMKYKERLAAGTSRLDSTAARDQPISYDDERIPAVNDSGVITIFSRKFNKVLTAVHINVVLYSTFFFVQAQVLPYLTKKMGLDSVVYGYLQAAFAVAQLIGGPVFGRFGDIYGARAAMTLAFGSGVVTYALLSVAHTLPVLFLSRFAALFLAGMQGSQMIVTDVTSTRERADALSKLGVSYGIGMIVGPFLGGLITKSFGEKGAALASCFGSFISMVIAFKFTPKHVKKGGPAKSSHVFSLRKIAHLMKYPNMLFLLSVKILEGLPLGVFQSMFSVVAIDTFNLSSKENGMLMSYIGLLTLVTQGIGVGVLTKRYPDGPLLKASAIVLVVAYLGLAYATDLVSLCVVVIPLAAGLTLMQMVISSSVTKAVPSCDTGGVVGMNMATNSLVRMLSPLMGGYMLDKWGFSSIGFYGCLSSVISSVLLFIYG